MIPAIATPTLSAIFLRASVAAARSAPPGIACSLETKQLSVWTLLHGTSTLRIDCSSYNFWE